MVGRVVEGREAEPVAFDFGTVGNVEADGAEDLLDAHPCAHNGVDAAFGADAARKGHVDRFAGELGLHGGLSELFAAGVERGFDSGLGLVDFLTAGAALFGRELAEALHESRHGAAFADVLGLGVFQGSGLLCLSEVLTRGLDEFGKILHVH